MRNFSILALVAASVGVANVGHAVAASMGGMGDVSANMRANQATCEAQRRGEYPRYHNACLPDYPDDSAKPVRH